MIYLHYGADQRRADATQDSVQWLAGVLAAVNVPVGIGTFGVEDAVRGVRAGAALVAIGHPIFDAPDLLSALTDFVQQVKGCR